MLLKPCKYKPQSTEWGSKKPFQCIHLIISIEQIKKDKADHIKNETIDYFETLRKKLISRTVFSI